MCSTPIRPDPSPPYVWLCGIRLSGIRLSLLMCGQLCARQAIGPRVASAGKAAKAAEEAPKAVNQAQAR